MKCNRKDCGKDADYIVDGESVCKEHKKDQEDTDIGGGAPSKGQLLSGM